MPQHGNVSEADTRAKLIDAILKDVCGWPETAISREDHVDRGYTDYILSAPARRAVVVEAKREGLPFTMPVGPAKSLKLSGALVTDDSIREAVTQVRGYCDDAGIRHAIATNGYAWIVFRAIRDDMPWREGRARVFPTLEAIIERFTEFWNLLSYDAVLAGSLEEEFGVPRRPASRTLSGRRLWGGVRNSFPLGPIDHECPLRRCGVRLRRREGLTRRLDQGTVPETRQPSSRQSHRGWPDRSSAECRFPPAQQPPLPPYPWAGEPAAAHR